RHVGAVARRAKRDREPDATRATAHEQGLASEVHGFLHIARTYSRLRRWMFATEISLGQTASHSPSLEQAPNPSFSICATMASTRRARSGWPWGTSVMWLILAPTKRTAEAFLHAATQAPQPMQAAASIAWSATSFGIGMRFASGALPVS